MSEGVYQFGQRRVFIKIGAKRKDGQQSILVKVGGGFINIDSFVDQFTQVEVDKVDNRKEEFNMIHESRLSRFHDKMQNGRSPTRNEVSPMRTHSPMKVRPTTAMHHSNKL